MPPFAGYSIENRSSLAALTDPEDRSDGFARLVKLGLDGKPHWYVYDEDSFATADNDGIIEPLDGVGRWFMVERRPSIKSYGSTSELSASSTFGLDIGAIAYASEMSFNANDPVGGFYRLDTGASITPLGNLIFERDVEAGRWIKTAPLVHVSDDPPSTYDPPPFPGVHWVNGSDVYFSTATAWVLIS